MILLDHPTYTNQEVADDAKCSIRTVNYARTKLVKEGIVPASYFDRSIATRTLNLTSPTRTAPPTAPPVTDSDTSLEPVAPTGDHDLTIDESLSMLAGFAKSAEREGNYPLAKDAVLAHRKLKDAFTSVELGPPPPQTDEDKVSRTTNILDVVGPTLTATAICQAFILVEDRKAFEEEFSRQSVTHPPKDDTRASTLAGDSSNAQAAESQESPPLDPGHPESPPDIHADVPVNKTDTGLGRGEENEAGLRNSPGLEPDLGSPGEVDPTP